MSLTWTTALLPMVSLRDLTAPVQTWEESHTQRRHHWHTVQTCAYEKHRHHAIPPAFNKQVETADHSVSTVINDTNIHRDCTQLSQGVRRQWRVTDGGWIHCPPAVTRRVVDGCRWP